MPIIRTQHSKNYTVVNNHICKDDRLSYKAKGIWLYAFSRPDDWTFHSREISKHATDGKDSVESGLRELVEAHYLVRDRIRNDDGTLGETCWVFYEVPKLKEFVPKPENPDLVEPDLVSPPILSTDLVRSTESTTTTSYQEDPPQGDEVVVVFPCLQRLKITDTLKTRLSREHPEEKLILAVERCLKWKARQNDEVGILTTLQKADTWTDIADKQQVENDNLVFLKTLEPMDGKMIGPMRMVVGYNYVEFVAGSQCTRYEISSKDFIANVEQYLKRTS